MNQITEGPFDTHYLDHAASTPMLAEAVQAMTSQLTHVGNASSLHASGRAVRRVVEESRETIARAIGCRPGEVVFTSGGTESDNLAVKGLFWGRRTHDPARRRILVSAVEHHAVLDPAFWMAEHAGAEIVLLSWALLLRLRALRVASHSSLSLARPRAFSRGSVLCFFMNSLAKWSMIIWSKETPPSS